MTVARVTPVLLMFSRSINDTPRVVRMMLLGKCHNLEHHLWLSSWQNKYDNQKWRSPWVKPELLMFSRSINDMTRVVRMTVEGNAATTWSITYGISDKKYDNPKWRSPWVTPVLLMLSKSINDMPRFVRMTVEVDATTWSVTYLFFWQKNMTIINDGC